MSATQVGTNPNATERGRRSARMFEYARSFKAFTFERGFAARYSDYLRGILEVEPSSSLLRRADAARIKQVLQQLWDGTNEVV